MSSHQMSLLASVILKVEFLKSAIGIHFGLYICDVSIIPCSVGINGHCLTVAAAAEHVSRHVVQDAIKYVKDSD